MSLFSRIFKIIAPPTPVFVMTDPEAIKREQRAMALRAQVEKEAACLTETSYVECRKYGEHVIGQVNRDEVTLQAAYALIHGFISRKMHRLAPPNVVNVQVVKGAA